MSLLAVNYHYVGMPNFKYQGVNGLSIDKFLEHLNYLRKNFKLISLLDLDNLNISKENYCIITFDDGLLCHYKTIFKLMKKEKFPAAFFVNTMPFYDKKAIPTHKMHISNAKLPSELIKKKLKVFFDSKNLVFPEVCKDTILSSYRYDSYENAFLKYIINYFLVEKDRNEFINILFNNLFVDEAAFTKEWYINEEQIKEMDDFLPCIGSHAHSHIPLGKLSDRDANYELKKSKKILEDVLKRKVRHFSFPLGNKNSVKQLHGHLAKKAGYEYAFTMERELNNTYEDKLLLARIDCNDLPIVGKSPLFKIEDKKLIKLNGSLSGRKRYYQE